MGEKSSGENGENGENGERRIMVSIVKGWYLDADNESYLVGKLGEDGKIKSPAHYSKAADAVNHVIEEELREGTSKTELVKCGEFIAMYSAIADEVIDAVKETPCGLDRGVLKNYRTQRETRSAACYM